MSSLALSACGGGGGGSAQPAPAAPGTAASAPAAPAAGGGGGTQITIKNFMFSPADLSVKRGQPITVTNQDGEAHTLTAGDKSFDSGNLAQGKSYTFTPAKAGTFTYVCTIHQYMTGKLTVS